MKNITLIAYLLIAILNNNLWFLCRIVIYRDIWEATDPLDCQWETNNAIKQNTVRSQKYTKGDELKWLLKEGGVCVFSRTFSPENRSTQFGSRPTLFESMPTQVLKIQT